MCDTAKLAAKIEGSIIKFLDWLDNFGYSSYDQYDFWDTSLGVRGKKLFLKNKALASPIVLPIQICESFFPSARKIFASKRRFAIGDAHFASGFMNLFKYYEDEKYLDRANLLLEEVLNYKTTTNNGIGWGYPYIWPTQYRIFEIGEPVITVTPYVFDAFLKMYEISKEDKLLSILEKIANFIAFDIQEEEISSEVWSSSYGPFDRSKVINAISYRAATLLKAHVLLNKKELSEKAERNINFILNEQQSDGRWYYAADSRFIDNFHTCFVLSKLTESYKILKDGKILESIKSGYKFLIENFIRKDTTLIHFYKTRFPKFRKIEMYDYAENISLGILLKGVIDEAFSYSKIFASYLTDNFQLPQGYFITRISTLGTRNKIPYLRWPQAQLFYSLTNLLVQLD